ncbi:MAG: 2-phosphosulfolactate phosphatase [Bernardetiaceae bacterium]
MPAELDICLTPDLLHLYDLTGKVVVVVDIFRATSCMVAGLGSGVTEIVPVLTIEECYAYKPMGYVLAGERNGIAIEDFDLGNSPLGFIRPELAGKKIAMTTTNGTKALSLSRAADQVIVGAFLNIQTVIDYLRAAQKDVLLVCAGWRGNVNMEDTLFAGAVAEQLAADLQLESDTVQLSRILYARALAAPSLQAFLEYSKHYQRLVTRDPAVEADLAFNLTLNSYPVLPYLDGERLLLL